MPNRTMLLPKKVYCIGGVPSIGKSYVAKLLAQKYGFDLISTDLIRRVMQSSAAKIKFPVLHYFKNQNPDEYFAKVKNLKFFDDFLNESREILTGIKGILINNKAVVGKIIILEGSALLPEIVSDIKKNIIDCDAVFILAGDENKFYKHIINRGLWAKSKRVKKRESKLIYELNNKIAEKVKSNGLNFVFNHPVKTLVERVEESLQI